MPKKKQLSYSTTSRKRKQAMRARREDPIFRKKEKAADKALKSARRRNSNAFKNTGRLRNAAARKSVRNDPDKHHRENQRKKAGKRRANFESYKSAIKEGPTWICCCCGGLWFRSSVTKYSQVDLRAKKIKPQILKEALFYQPEENIYFCSTCNRAILNNRLPDLALANGLDFQPIPPELEDITELEERLVSARIPFMQLRRLGADQQFGLHGNVVNVPVDVDSTVSVLPRQFSETRTIQLKLKRRLKYKTAYLFQTVRPRKVINAARCLANRPLYRQYNISVSDDWENDHSVETENFVVNADEDNTPEGSVSHKNTSQSQEVLPDIAGDDDLDCDPEDAVVFNLNDTLLDASDPAYADVNMGISIAPGEGKRPISILLDEHAEELAFPSIFCGYPRTFRKRLTYASVAKSELRRYDRRAARKIPKIFFAYKKVQLQRLAQTISICLRKNKRASQNLTAGEVRQKGTVDTLIQHDDGYRLLKHDRSSPAYLEDKKKDVLAMIRQCEKPTFFLTLSAAETRWLPLLVILEQTVNGRKVTEEEAAQFTFQQRAALIQNDPVTCARYVEYRFRTLLHKVVLSEFGPFSQNPVTDHYIRVEFQHRGSAHLHILLWLKDAPIFVEGSPTSEETCEKFIDSFCSVSITPESPELIKVQTHRHTFSCRKMQGKKKICRFGIPFPPMSKTRILLPLNETLLSKEDLTRLKAGFERIQEKLQLLEQKPELRNISFEEFLQSLQLSEEEYILLIRSSLKQMKVFLKRLPSEIMINPFNPTVLKYHEANMDLQYILNPYACAEYILSYISKSNRGMSLLMRQAQKELEEGNLTIRQRCRVIVNKFINASETSVQEAVFYLLGLPITVCSRGHVYINTAPPEQRVGLLKDEESLRRLDPESTEIMVEGLLEHYADRPSQLTNVCLADFAAWYEYSRSKQSADKDDIIEGDHDNEESTLAYDSNSASSSKARPKRTSRTQNLAKKRKIDVSCDKFLEASDSSSCSDFDEEWSYTNKTLPCGSGQLRKRSKAKVIRFRRYNVQQDAYNFFREQVMLFLPWRSETDDILHLPDIEAHYHKHETIISKNRMKYMGQDSDLIDDAIRKLEQRNQEEELTEESATLDTVDNAIEEGEGTYAGYHPPNAETAIDGLEAIGIQSCAQPLYEHFSLPSILSESSFISLFTKLNDKQRRYIMHFARKLKTKSIVHDFVTGGAGVGKSTLIKAIYQLILRYQLSLAASCPDEVSVLICAPTGKAAFNVGGMTLHSAFALPISQFRHEMPRLSDDIANKLAVALARLSLIIIDEASMMGRKLMYSVNTRLQQILHSNEPFGGLSALLVGDFNQLRPVCDAYAFEFDKKNPYGGIAGNPLWNLFSIFELTEVMRQQHDKVFALALTRFGNAEETEEDMKLFRSRSLSALGLEQPDGLLTLLATNEEVASHNLQALAKLQSEELTSIAMDTCAGSGSAGLHDAILKAASLASTQTTQGLPYTICLKIGGRYMITINIDTSDGLANGATGVLKAIDYINLKDGSRRPMRVWLKLDDDSGRAGTNARQRLKDLSLLRKYGEPWTPIEQTTRCVKSNKNGSAHVMRTQFPLTEAEGVTIHKSQSSTLDAVVIKLPDNPKIKLSRQQYYVAFSRAISSSGLYINGELPQLSKEKTIAHKEVARMKLEVPVQYCLTFLQDLPETSLKITFQNVQSLMAHEAFITCDPFYMQSDILLFVETWTLPADRLLWPGLNCAYRKDSGDLIRKASGCICFTQQSQREILRVVELPSNDASQIYGCVALYKDDIAIVCLHCLPQTTYLILLNVLDTTIAQLQDSKVSRVIILGDFNINMLQVSRSSNKLRLWISNNSFRSITPQQASTNYDTQIDLCLANFANIHSDYYEHLHSYHKPIWTEVTNAKITS